MKMMPAAQFSLARQAEYGDVEQQNAVRGIIEQVKLHGDAAIKRYTQEFDRVEVSSLRVQEEEIQSAYKKVDSDFLAAIREAARNIRAFHAKQKHASWMDVQPNGTMLGQILRPLRRVGLYVPGGKAAYPSSVLMNAIPAQIAGVAEIAMVTPPTREGEVNPFVLVAAAEAGIKEIYRVGGAQAIAALAYGTESIPAADKIVGPGNLFVAIAKRYVYGLVDIDSIAGPSEIVILADGAADPEFIAADLLSQAEHDQMASAILVTDSAKLGQLVLKEVARQLAVLPRKAIAEVSVNERGAVLLAANMDDAIATVNRIAPEHLEIMVQNPLEQLGRIENAGAVFLGPYSSEPVGDYFAGPNHILPTNGTARFSSALSVDDFIKKSSVIYYSKEALIQNGRKIMTLADREGLQAHARAIELRLNKEGSENNG